MITSPPCCVGANDDRELITSSSSALSLNLNDHRGDLETFLRSRFDWRPYRWITRYHLTRWVKYSVIFTVFRIRSCCLWRGPGTLHSNNLDSTRSHPQDQDDIIRFCTSSRSRSPQFQLKFLHFLIDIIVRTQSTLMAIVSSVLCSLAGRIQSFPRNHINRIRTTKRNGFKYS